VRPTPLEVEFGPIVLAAIAYLAVLTAVINFAQEVIRDEPIVTYLPGVLLAPLAFATLLPSPAEKSFKKIAGVTASATAGGAGAGAAIGSAGAGAFSGGLAAPPGALIGAIVGGLIGGLTGLFSALAGKKSCIRCKKKHKQTQYVCPNTGKYNLRPTEIEIPPEYWSSEEDAQIYIGVTFDLTEKDAKKATKQIYEHASADSNVRKDLLGGKMRIFHDDLQKLVGLKDWVADNALSEVDL
jgi:hypothetical protein